MDALLQTIARVARKPINQINPSLQLKEIGLSASIAITILQNALERQTGTKLAPLRWDMTIADLISQVTKSSGDLPSHVEKHSNGAPSGPANSIDAIARPAEPAAAPQLPGAAGFGIDIEEVNNLPLAHDMLTDEFYAGSFTQNELRNALTRPNARAHLCGLFAAKEALKKSDPELLNLRMSEIEVRHTADGAPRITTNRAQLNARFQFQISISHTDRYAVALAVTSKKAPL